MPVPIMPVPSEPNSSNKQTIDYSFLANVPSGTNKKTVSASNGDANSLFFLWNNGEKIGKDTYKIAVGTDMTMRDIMRLKAIGLIAGGSDKYRITHKGQVVLRVLSLGEQNNFLKKATPKNYNEILASINNIGKNSKSISKTASLEKKAMLKDKEAQIFIAILDGIQGKIHMADSGQADRCTVELETETPQGTAYIQVYMNEYDEDAAQTGDKNLSIERYYESEYINDSFQQTIKIPIDFENPKLTINQVNEVIEKMKVS